MIKSAKTLVIFLIISSSLFACSYPLKIKNTQEFVVTPKFSPTETRLNIGVSSFTGTPDEQFFYNIVLEKLSTKPFVGKMEAPYKFRNSNDSDEKFKPDFAISIEPHVDYNGSGWNYLITFPGFLIFTHAWNGFAYEADITTKINIINVKTNETRSFDIKTVYNFRHCDFGRGFWASSGWFLPGLGATSLIAGFFMIQYDDDATDEFQTHVKDNYGNYVVEKISDAI